MIKAQNTTFEELNSVLTRVGENTKVFVLGDTKQNDLINSRSEKSGFAKAIDVTKAMGDEFAMIQFTTDDIVRSKFVKSWIIACENLGL